MTDALDVARLLLHPRDVTLREELRGGGNNRLLRLDSAGESLVAKLYFDRDRLQAEYGFLRYATEELGLRCVPAPVGCDPEQRLGLYRYVEGRPVAAPPSAAQVRQAAAFFEALNAGSRAAAQGLPTASDGAFTLAGHVELVERRLERLGAIPTNEALDREARELVAALDGLLAPLVHHLRREAEARRISFDEPLAGEDRCVSPSDFGFHNALEVAGGAVVFLDFEYAGWDDPAKAIGDFFCQPLVPVDLRYLDEVAAAFTAHSGMATTLVERARILFPLAWFRWCLIRLNEFHPEALRRRVFADPGLDVDARKMRQLESARQAVSELGMVGKWASS